MPHRARVAGSGVWGCGKADLESGTSLLLPLVYQDPEMFPEASVVTNASALLPVPVPLGTEMVCPFALRKNPREGSPVVSEESLCEKFGEYRYSATNVSTGRPLIV